MSINVNVLTPPPTAPQQVATAVFANNYQNTTKLCCLDGSNNLGHKVITPNSFAEMYVYANTTATVVGATNTFYQFSSANWLLSPFSQNFVVEGTTGLKYTGTATGVFYCQANINATTGTNNQVCQFVLHKNSTPVSSSRLIQTMSNLLGQNGLCSCILQLATNDIVSLYIANGTASNNITLTDVSFEIFQLN